MNVVKEGRKIGPGSGALVNIRGITDFVTLKNFKMSYNFEHGGVPHCRSGEF